MATEEEDFSFPATTPDSPLRFIDSPPLWRPISVPPPHEKPVRLGDKEESKETNYSNQRKNFMYGMKIERREEDEEEEDDDVGDELEEKMDKLWEDLNEEFSRKLVADSDMSSSDRDVQISCIKTLKLSKPNGSKKLSILLLMKILMRKVFFAHNTHSSIKNRA